MFPVSRFQAVSPTMLLIVATLTPVLTAVVGHQLGERGDLGMMVGAVVTVWLAAAVITRSGIERYWYVLSALPVIFWIGSLIWYSAVVS